MKMLSKKKLPVAVIVNTLNDGGRELHAFFQSIVRNGPKQFIVVDGGSTDGTATVARNYTDEVYVVAPGVFTQHLLAVSKARQKYIFIVETDHLLPDGCIERILIEKIKLGCASVQASLVCRQKNNFIEKGQAIFYELNQNVNDYIEVPNAPAIWETSEYIRILEKMDSINELQGYAVDTIKADALRAAGIKVWLSEIFAWQNERLNLRIYKRKMVHYGYGDYDYLMANRQAWSVMRIMKSISHVFRRYFIMLPVISGVRRKSLIFIPFSVLSGILRYYGFFRAMCKSK